MERKFFPKRPVPYREHVPTEQCIIMYGTLDNGYQAVGPFKDFDTAKEWYSEMHPTECEIIYLYEPKLSVRMERFNPDLES